jgi:hypothetical protein
MQLLAEGYDPVVEVAAVVVAAAAAYDSDVGSSLFVTLEQPVCYHCILCVTHFVTLKTR